MTDTELEELRSALAPRYDVDREVGRGGMATVYRATDTQSDSREVAVKVLLSELSAAVGAERFRREIEIASTLDHPRILSALDAGVAGDSLYLVMPFVRGETLRERMRREGQLPIEDAITIAREAAEALTYAHARGFVHRDVKPENILLEDGHAIVADFGIARVITDNVDATTLTRTGVAVGTPLYMSPEQAAAERTLDGRSDQYSLGAVLFEMLVGQPPFTGNSSQMLMARHALEPVPGVRVVRQSVPEHVEDAIFRAMEKSPADRFPSVEAFAKALGEPGDWRFARTGTRTGLRRRRGNAWWRRRPGAKTLAVAGVGLALAVAGAGGYAWKRGTVGAVAAGPTVTVAVAPFQPLRSEVALWQEGMVDVLSRSLDGAGPLRAVSPAVVLRGWSGKLNDRDAARALGRRTDARFAVYGDVNANGGAFHVTAHLLDVRSDSEAELFEASGIDVSRLADSLTFWVLTQVDARVPLGAVRRPSPFGGATVTALKPFLEGEQAYRRTAWNEAASAYARAIALDTGFALAFHRAGQIQVWKRDAIDSLARVYALRAGQLNHGLGPRDSLLLAADSLSAALSASRGELPDWAIVRRLFATVNEAAALFPGDPEVWFSLGEARHHYGYGQVTGVTEQSVLDAFDRAIALDSGFAPAYIHAVELGFVLHGRDAGRRYAAAYLALQPTDAEADAIALVQRLTDPTHADSAGTARLLDTASTDVLSSAEEIVARWPDSAYTATRLIQTVARRPHDSPSHADDSLLVQVYLPNTLAFRGRLREAHAELRNKPSRVAAEIALLGGMEPDTARAMFARWLAAGIPQAELALPWWAEHRDTTSIARLARHADSLVSADARPRYIAPRYTARAARAYLSLARATPADTGTAIDGLRALGDTLCLTCYGDRLVLARLLAARHRDAEAIALLRPRLYTIISPAEVWIALERARIAARLGDRAEAARSYAFVVAAWADGDDELRPAVTEARRALGMATVASTAGLSQFVSK